MRLQNTVKPLCAHRTESMHKTVVERVGLFFFFLFNTFENARILEFLLGKIRVVGNHYNINKTFFVRKNTNCSNRVLGFPIIEKKKRRLLDLRILFKVTQLYIKYQFKKGTPIFFPVRVQKLFNFVQIGEQPRFGRSDGSSFYRDPGDKIDYNSCRDFYFRYVSIGVIQNYCPCEK